MVKTSQRIERNLGLRFKSCDFKSLQIGAIRSAAHCAPRIGTSIREKQRGGGKLRGGGKHTIKPLPKNGFGPPTYDTFPPPPLCSRNVITLRGNGHRPDQSHFRSPPKLVLEGTLYGTFPPPPPKIARYVSPPPLAAFQKTRRFRDPAVLFYYHRNFFATTVVNSYDRSIFNMAGLGCRPKGAYGNTAFWEGFWEGSGKGSGEGVLRRVLRRQFPEGAWDAPLRSTPP